MIPNPGGAKRRVFTPLINCRVRRSFNFGHKREFFVATHPTRSLILRGTTLGFGMKCDRYIDLVRY
jgi:hypothetical protein